MTSVSGERERIPGPAGALVVDVGGHSASESFPVVLVHSLAGNSSHWAVQLQHLRPHRQAIAVDLRGHGRSEPPRDGNYTIAAMAGDVAAVVDTLKLGRFVLVGHSMGGGVALTYAGGHPERVAGLVLVDPIGDGTQIPAAEARAFLSGFESNYDTASRKHWSTVGGADSTVRSRLMANLQDTPQEAVVQGLRSVMEFDPLPALERYQGPMLSVVTPYNDQPFSLHRLGKGFPHLVVQDTGHWIQLDKPDEFNHMLDDFLEKSVR